MEPKLKIPFALRDGVLIHISDVESGSKHGGVCAVCNRPLIARKGAQKRHHFAHQADVQCNPETVLHKLGKILLQSQIETALKARRDVPVTWKCSRCADEHKGNLLRKASAVRLEFPLTGCRPDLTLFDENDNPIAIIEIVVQHAPEEHVREFCKTHSIGVLEYHIRTDNDLDALRSLDEFCATVGSVCLRKKCATCKEPLHTKSLYVVDGVCWKCRNPMKVAFMACEGLMSGPEEFTMDDASLARREGAMLRERYSNVVRRRYLANVCASCGSFVGEFYIHDYWDLADENNKVAAGYECWHCNGMDLPSRAWSSPSLE